MLIRSTVALLLIFAQQQAPAPPVFKTGINLVEVDVVALDKRGLPVRGLRQQDFDVFEDDKPVAIAAFDAVDLPAAESDASLPPADRSETSLASNDQAQDGRVLLIVMDDHHVRFGANQFVKAKAIARRLVERLGPFDQAAVIATSGRSVMQAEFTFDKARLLAAIDKFFPQADGTTSGFTGGSSMPRGIATQPEKFGFERELKARWAMDALSNAAKTLALIPHRRKAILLVSEGLPASVEQIVSDPNASSAWQSFRDFILTAQRSNVAVYPVDPCGLDLDCSRASQDNLRALAEHTGGFAVVNTNAPEDQVERIVAESGTYYLLGYASPAPPNDGRRHRIKVRSRVPDVEIRARESYVSPRHGARTTTPGSGSDALIAAPIQTRGLTMRLAAVPAPLASSPGAAIVVAIEIPAKSAIEAASVDFTIVAVDPSSGRVRARQRFTNTFEQSGSRGVGWARFRSHLAVAPGRYLLRVAAVGANKNQGSVFTEVNVPKFDGDLALGGLSIAAAGVRVAPVNDKDAAKVLTLTPLATREISLGIPLAAEVPIKVGTRAGSTPLAITVTLQKPDGSVTEIDTPQPDLSAHAKPGGETYRVALPRDLAPGSYRVTVEATSGRARAMRETTFRVNAVE